MPVQAVDAELAGGVVAPGPDAAVGQQGQAVTVAGCQRGHLAEPGHADWHSPSGRGAVPELAVGVVAPGPEAPVGGRGQAVAAPRGDEGDVVEADHPTGDCVRTSPIGRLVAQLPEPVLSPGPGPSGRRVCGSRLSSGLSM